MAFLAPVTLNCVCVSFTMLRVEASSGKAFMFHTWCHSDMGYYSDLIYCFSRVCCKQLWRLYRDLADRVAVALVEHLDLWQESDFQLHVKSQLFPFHYASFLLFCQFFVLLAERHRRCKCPPRRSVMGDARNPLIRMSVVIGQPEHHSQRASLSNASAGQWGPSLQSLTGQLAPAKVPNDRPELIKNRHLSFLILWMCVLYSPMWRNRI